MERILHADWVLHPITLRWSFMNDASRQHERILLVEDDPDLCRAVARVFRREGLEVTAAPSCLAARALTCPFYLGVFDIGLGDGDGVELAAELLERKRLARAVFFTSAGRVETHRRARRVGPVVHKSDGAEALLQVVLGILGRRATTSSGILPTATCSERKRETG
jgi:DNA-binding response OmpR family regulator